MGRQIQHILTSEDEEKLISYLQAKFPIRVVNARYPPDWDRMALERSENTNKWVIIDERVKDLVLESSTHIESSGEWQIRSIARSCIEWNRDLYHKGVVPGRGRLFLDTKPNDIYMDISAETGDDIEKQFRRAVSWLKKNCINVSKYKYGIWQSKKL